MINKRFDLIAGSAFLAIGAFFVIASRGITSSSYGSNVGPSVFPTLLGLVLAGLSVGVIWKALSFKGEGKKGSAGDFRTLATVIAAAAVYIAIFEPAGYVISTFLFLTFMFQLLERKQLWKSALIAAAFAGAVYSVYVVVFQGTLPPFPEFLTAPFAGG